MDQRHQPGNAQIRAEQHDPPNSMSASPSGIGEAISKHRRCPGSPGVSLAHVFTNKVVPFLRDKKLHASL